MKAVVHQTNCLQTTVYTKRSGGSACRSVVFFFSVFKQQNNNCVSDLNVIFSLYEKNTAQLSVSESSVYCTIVIIIALITASRAFSCDFLLQQATCSLIKDRSSVCSERVLCGGGAPPTHTHTDLFLFLAPNGCGIGCLSPQYLADVHFGGGHPCKVVKSRNKNFTSVLKAEQSKCTMKV